MVRGWLCIWNWWSFSIICVWVSFIVSWLIYCYVMIEESILYIYYIYYGSKAYNITLMGDVSFYLVISYSLGYFIFFSFLSQILCCFGSAWVTWVLTWLNRIIDSLHCISTNNFFSSLSYYYYHSRLYWLSYYVGDLCLSIISCWWLIIILLFYTINILGVFLLLSNFLVIQ